MSTGPREGKVRVNFECPPYLWARFEEVAQAAYRSRSDHLRFLMAEALREHDEANRGLGRAE